METLTAPIVMWRFNLILLILLSLIVPTGVFALDCSSKGYTVVFVNGIFTSKAQAQDSAEQLKRALASSPLQEPTVVQLGYNSSHLDGGGDLAQSLMQAFNGSVSDFDLDTILMQIYPQLHTQKVLIVGHSQGSFYANELYKYLVTHGVSPESIGVYAIATPASMVAGGGGYLTSTNDKVINLIRNTEVSGNEGIYVDSHHVLGPVIASALRANTTILKESGWDTDDYGGHHFSVYLNGAGNRIVNSIDRELSQLKSSGSNTAECFTPPQKTLGYEMEAAAFAVADPLTEPIIRELPNAAEMAIGPIATMIKGIVATRGVFAYVLDHTVINTEVAGAEAAVAPAPQTTAPTKPKTVVSETGAPQAPAPSPTVPEPAPKRELPTKPSLPAQVSPVRPFSISPGFGGGGGIVHTATEDGAVSAADAIPFNVTSPIDGALLATSTVVVSGSSPAGALIVSPVGTTTADGAGNWMLTITLPEGPSTIDLHAEDGSESSGVTSRAITVDTHAPDATALSISDCALSLVTSFCALPVSTVDLQWTAVPDAASYGIAVNGVVVATTTELTATEPMTANATTTFAIVSFDAAGNAATSTNIDVYGLSRPLIINEIDWAGDNATTSNQWIELKNLSSYDLDLAHMTIEREGGDSITLSGIAPTGQHPYLVVEPTNVPYTSMQKLITPFTLLSASSERLTLVWNGHAIDGTPAVAICGGWCAGATIQTLGKSIAAGSGIVTPLSMERASDDSDGALRGSWHSTDSYGPYFSSDSLLTWWGTPGTANSYGWPDAGVYCGTGDGLIAEDQNGNEQMFDTGTGGCIYLARFIAGGFFGSTRYAGLYEGTVGNSIVINSHSMGKSLAYWTPDAVPAGTPAGEHFFFAIWEVRDFPPDSLLFDQYFTLGASTTLGYTAPHGNYVTIPFTYQP